MEVTFKLRSGRTLRGLTYGNASSEHKWIFLHGWLDNANSFSLVAPTLATDYNINILALDLPGHGLSDHNQSPAYHMVDYVSDVHAVLIRAGWISAVPATNKTESPKKENRNDLKDDDGSKFVMNNNKIHILGHSLGGGIAAMYAASFPDYVKSLVMLESLGPWPGNTENFVPDLRLSILKSASKSVDFDATYKSSPSLMYSSKEEATQRRSEGNQINALPLDAAALLVERGLIKVPSEEKKLMWATDPALLYPSRQRISNHQLHETMKAIKVPSLTILADDGIFLPVTKAARRYGIDPFGTIMKILLCALPVCLNFVNRYYFKGRSTSINRIQSFAHMWWGHGSVKNMEISRIKYGGHHPQITVPKETIEAIGKWVKKTQEQ